MGERKEIRFSIENKTKLRSNDVHSSSCSVQDYFCLAYLTFRKIGGEQPVIPLHSHTCTLLHTHTHTESQTQSQTHTVAHTRSQHCRFSCYLSYNHFFCSGDVSRCQRFLSKVNVTAVEITVQSTAYLFCNQYIKAKSRKCYIKIFP